MLVPVLLALIGASVLGVLASIIMVRATNHSGLASLIWGALLSFVVLAAAVALAWAMTRAWLPH